MVVLKRFFLLLFLAIGVRGFSSLCPLVDKIWVDYSIGETVGIHGNYGTLGFYTYLPTSVSPNWYWTAELDLHILKHKNLATNAGGGFRYLSPDQSKLLGANVFYDYRENFCHSFHQLGVGCEYLSCLFDCIANYYIPLATTEKKVNAEVFDDYIGDYFARMTDEDQTFTGFNLELGKRCCLGGSLLINPAFGPYYFSNLNHGFWGWKFRTSFELNSMLGFEVDVTRDRIFKTRTEVILSLELPLQEFCQRAYSACYDLLNYKIHRFRIIPLTRCSDWLWNW